MTAPRLTEAQWAALEMFAKSPDRNGLRFATVNALFKRGMLDAYVSPTRNVDITYRLTTKGRAALAARGGE